MSSYKKLLSSWVSHAQIWTDGSNFQFNGSWSGVLNEKWLLILANKNFLLLNVGDKSINTPGNPTSKGFYIWNNYLFQYSLYIDKTNWRFLFWQDQRKSWIWIKIQIWSLHLCMKIRQQAGCMWHQRFWLPCPAAKPLLNTAYFICPLSITSAAPFVSVGHTKELCIFASAWQGAAWKQVVVSSHSFALVQGFPKCSRIWKSLSSLVTSIFWTRKLLHRRCLHFMLSNISMLLGTLFWCKGRHTKCACSYQHADKVPVRCQSFSWGMVVESTCCFISWNQFI